MPQDGSNNYQYPPGTPGITDQSIESESYNTFLDDLVVNDLNIARPIHRGGTGAVNATQARANLSTEVASAPVTNFDSQVWESGSFHAAATATGAPPVPGGHSIGGIAVVLGDPAQHVIVQAMDHGTGDIYTRTKVSGVWGAWTMRAGSTADLDAAYVNVTGDTMTGNLRIAPNPVGHPSLFLDAATGYYPSIISSVNGLYRWAQLTGTDFIIQRYNDAGVSVDFPLTIKYATGDTTLTGLLTITKPGGHNFLTMNADTTFVNAQRFQINNILQWQVNYGPGSLTFYRADATGTLVDQPIVIQTTGLMEVKADPTALLGVATKQYVDAAATAAGTGKVNRTGDTMTGILIGQGSLGDIASQTGGGTPGNFQVIGGGGANAAFMTFHRPGSYGAMFGVDSDNQWKLGGWSVPGVAHRVVHEGLASPLLTSVNSASYMSAATFYQGQALIVQNGAAGYSGSVAFRSGAGAELGSLFFDSNNFYIRSTVASTDTVITSGGRIILAQGFYSRAGVGGALGGTSGGHTHNFNWVGALEAWVDGSMVGNVSLVSDYRIKKNVTELPSTWDTVKALRPVKYTQAEYTPQIEKERKLKEAIKARETNSDVPEAKENFEHTPMFPADDKERWGFVAHELQEATIMDAATGVKDAPDVVQSPNPWTIIAALTKTIQEMQTRIEALEAA